MLLAQLKSLLQKYNLWAKKRLGQNFLVDEVAFDKIIEAANLTSEDHVVEVGPGTGFLTERLLKRVKQVTAVEYDATMVSMLKAAFAGAKNLNLIHQDALKFRTQETGHRKQPYKVVANIPYYITSPLLKHFLQSGTPPSLMVLLVQKEVAEKVCGISGKSMITIETQVFGASEIIATVPAQSFYPIPQVDSAILRINVYPESLIPMDKLRDFLRLVGFGFTQKRKKLSNALAAGLHLETEEVRQLLEKAKIDSNLRAENLKIGDWKKLTKLIF